MAKGLVVGLTGTYCAGKGETGKILEKIGFIGFSLSDVLRMELGSRGLPYDRDILIDEGNRFRSTYGPGILAYMAVSSVKSRPGSEDSNFFIDSIRNPAEVEALRRAFPKFSLWELQAPVQIRAERMRLRGRPDDLANMDELLAHEEREQSDDPNKQQLRTTARLADYMVNNQGTLADLDGVAQNTLSAFAKQRPAWDEYFMGIMEAVSQRATCDRGKSGAVIVRDKRILSTGYVGSPVGVPHCDDVGHLLEKRVNPDGTLSEHCIRTAHAERNAIDQAARHGISINGGTIYCRMEPCRDCATDIINAGIVRVVAQRRYHRAQLTREWFSQAGVKLDVLHDEDQKY